MRVLILIFAMSTVMPYFNYSAVDIHKDVKPLELKAEVVSLRYKQETLITNVHQLHEALQRKGVNPAYLMAQVAAQECGDSLNSRDFLELHNMFGITKICADHYGFKYLSTVNRYDAPYVKFRSQDECLDFIKLWCDAVPIQEHEDPYEWLTVKRRYNPGDPRYARMVKSHKFWEW